MKLAIASDHGGYPLKAVLIPYLREQGLENDLSPTRLHHEIYLSDARKVPPEKWRTVIRHPVRPASRP